MHTVKIKLSEIHPYENNPRHNDDAVNAVAESITQYGYLNPIIVDEEMVIVAGHTRYLALKKMGRTEAEVIVAEDLTPEQVREYRIIDNKTSELATWDNEKLIPELRALPHINVFESFFPDLKFDHQSVNFNQVTEDEVEKPKTKPVKKEVAVYTCPHCGGEFDAEA